MYNLFIYLFKDRISIIETPQGIHHFCLLDRLQFCCQPGSDLGQTWPVHISQVGEMLAKICPKAPFGRTNGDCIKSDFSPDNIKRYLSNIKFVE